MATLQQITTRAKAIYKKHPSKKWTDCIKLASKELKGQKVSGTRKTKRVSGVKKTKKKPAIKIVTIGKVAPKKIGATSVLSRGKAILSGIGRMERQYKGTKDRDLKKLLAHAINLEHDKLDALTKLKRKIK
jgi:hypothetical protein